MRRIIVPSLTVVLALALSAAAAAEGNDGKKGGVIPVGATSVPEPVPAPVTQTQTTTSGEAAAQAQPPDVSKSEARLQAIRDRAAKMPATDREEIEKKLEGNAKDVDVEAVTNGDATVADRFAAEFGMTSEALLAERTQYNVGWGEVMIAHTLLANAPSGTTIDQLYTLHADGMGWGQVAFGMGLRVGSVAAAVKTETMVARGSMKADGKTAKIGTSTRVASAGGAHTRTGQSRAEAATSAAAGTGAKVTK
jgi:hypothetical protein